MASGMRKIGNWQGVAALVDNLKQECVEASHTSLVRFGLKAEAIAKKHIRDQDLNWIPLNPQYLFSKIAEGYSEKTLVRTSTYFQNITSWVGLDTAYIGVKKGIINPDGEYIDVIARTLEYGTAPGIKPVVPPRPLWQPTLKEVIEWHKVHNMPETIFLKTIKKKYGV